MDGLVKNEQHTERHMQRAALHDHRMDHISQPRERERPSRPRLSRGVSTHRGRRRLNEVSAGA